MPSVEPWWYGPQKSWLSSECSTCLRDIHQTRLFGKGQSHDEDRSAVVLQNSQLFPCALKTLLILVIGRSPIMYSFKASKKRSSLSLTQVLERPLVTIIVQAGPLPPSWRSEEFKVSNFIGSKLECQSLHNHTTPCLWNSEKHPFKSGW